MDNNKQNQSLCKHIVRSLKRKSYCLKSRKLPAARYICQCRLKICQCRSFAFQKQKNGCLHNQHDNHILFDQSGPRYKTVIDSECTRCQLSQKGRSQIAFLMTGRRAGRTKGQKGTPNERMRSKTCSIKLPPPHTPQGFQNLPPAL